MLMAGVQHPSGAATAGLERTSIPNQSQAFATSHFSPSMGKTDVDGTQEGLGSDLATAGPEMQVNSQSHHSLQMVQTKQDREKRAGDPLYETQNLPAYGQPRVRIAGVSPGKPAKKMSLSQLKNRKLNKFQGHAYGLRSQSPGRSPPRQDLGASDGQPEGQIDIEDQ